MVPQSQTTASLAIRLSEIREKLNATNLETADEDSVKEYEALSNEHKDIEKRYRLSMERDMSQVQDEKETKPETREKEALVSELRAHVYMSNILDDKEITSGPEAEFNAEAGLRGANWIPWEALMPQVEERADDVSAKPADADLSTTQQNILPRLFPQSVANWAGLRMPSQGVGIPSYPIMTAGPSVAEVAVGAEHDSSAGTWSFTTIMPTRVTGGYRVNVESLAIFAGMEQSLRRDLTAVFADKFDSLFLEEMFATVANNGLPLGAAPSAVPSYQGFLDELIDLVDGQYAVSTSFDTPSRRAGAVPSLPQDAAKHGRRQAVSGFQGNHGNGNPVPLVEARPRSGIEDRELLDHPAAIGDRGSSLARGSLPARRQQRRGRPFGHRPDDGGRLERKGKGHSSRNHPPQALSSGSLDGTAVS